MSLLEEMNEMIRRLGINYLDKHKFFYYNFTNNNTAFIERDTKGHTTMDYLPENGVAACNTLLGNSQEDVEAAVACSFDGDWSNFDEHPIRKIYREDVKYPTVQLPFSF